MTTSRETVKPQQPHPRGPVGPLWCVWPQYGPQSGRLWLLWLLWPIFPERHPFRTAERARDEEGSDPLACKARSPPAKRAAGAACAQATVAAATCANRQRKRRSQAMGKGGRRSTSWKRGQSGNRSGRPKRAATVEAHKIIADVKAAARELTPQRLERCRRLWRTRKPRQRPA
jgi:hypothetical protein